MTVNYKQIVALFVHFALRRCHDDAKKSASNVNLINIPLPMFLEIIIDQGSECVYNYAQF